MVVARWGEVVEAGIAVVVVFGMVVRWSEVTRVQVTRMKGVL